MSATAVLSDSRRSLTWLARAGYAASGVLYLTAGALATSFAIGAGGRPDVDSRSALARVVAVPLGRVLLGVMALGLLGYAAWRIVDGVKGIERPRHDARSIAVRIGRVARGVVYLGLAWSAARLALWHEGSGGGARQRPASWTSKLVDSTGGKLVLYGVAAALVGYGAYQLSRAWRAKLDRHLELTRLPRRAARVVVGLSRFGIAARAIVFGTIGVLIARATWDRDPREAGGTAKAMTELLDLGRLPFLAIALGLAAYGVYRLLNARYRRIELR